MWITLELRDFYPFSELKEEKTQLLYVDKMLVLVKV